MPATTETVQDTVFKALEEFGAEPDQITPDATFEALDIDSLDLAELAQIVEDEYSVKISGEDMESIKTVGDVIELITARAS